MRTNGDEKMNFDDSLLVTAIIVFTLMIIGLGLTVKEFHNMKDKDN
jgi:uncharacterized Tic20 family protein